MHPKMHGFAFVLPTRNAPPEPALASPETVNAPALKATSQAGRRGGESIARLYAFSIYLFNYLAE